jgi:hypothetical protein
MSDQPTKDDEVSISLKWPLDDNLQTVYANQFAISGPGPEYVIVFGEFLPTGFADRPKKEIEEYLRDAVIKPVAKVVVSPEGLEAFYGLLKGYMEKQKKAA